MNFRNFVHFAPIPIFWIFLLHRHLNFWLSLYMTSFNIISATRLKFEDGNSSFIVTLHVISICVHFSASIINTLATFGPATPTKHEWSLQYPYRVLAMTPRILKIFEVFPYLGIITTHMQTKNFDYTNWITLHQEKCFNPHIQLHVG